MSILPSFSVLGKAIFGRTSPGQGASGAVTPSSLAQMLIPYLVRPLSPQPGTGLSSSSSGNTNTLSLAPSGVTPGAYTNTNLTVDTTGRITVAANGTGGSGSGITQLTADVTAGPGSGSQAATLATVNSNVGTFQGLTVNAKGLTTAAVAMSGDATMSAGAITFATVNSNVGTFQGLTVNAKGLVTAAANQSYLTGNQTITLTGFVTGSGATSIATSLGATVTVAQGGTGITSGTSGGIPYYSSTSTIASSALLPATAVMKGGGAGASPTASSSWTLVSGILIGNLNAVGFVNPIVGDIVRLQQADGVSNVLDMNSFAASNFIVASAAGGTGATPTALAGQFLLNLQGRGFDGTAWSSSSASILMQQITSPWTTSDHSTTIQFFTVPVGSTTLDATADLDIRSAGVKIKGTNTNDSAAAGFVGEYLSTIKLIANTVSLTTATPANITSLALTVGDWDVWGELWLDAATTTTCSFATGAIATTTGTIPSVPADGTAVATTSFEASATISTTGRVLLVGPCRVSLSAGATMFLNVEAVFGVSTLSCYGKICARRRR